MFEGSLLTYNPVLNEAEWIPMRGLANDLSWGEERSAVALANYIPRVQREGKRIARLRVSRVVSSLGDDTSTTSMEEEKESWFLDTPSMSSWTDMDCEADEESEGAKGSEGDVSGWKSPEEGGEASPYIDQCQHSWYWESIMEESEGLAFDDLCSGSDTTVTGANSLSVPPFSPHDELGDSPPTRSRGSAPHSLWSPMEAGGMPPLTAAFAMPASGANAVEVHVSQSELDNL